MPIKPRTGVDESMISKGRRTVDSRKNGGRLVPA
jgi:hypothetical protein